MATISFKMVKQKQKRRDNSIPPPCKSQDFPPRLRCPYKRYHDKKPLFTPKEKGRKATREKNSKTPMESLTKTRQIHTLRTVFELSPPANQHTAPSVVWTAALQSAIFPWIILHLCLCLEANFEPFKTPLRISRTGSTIQCYNFLQSQACVFGVDVLCPLCHRRPSASMFKLNAPRSAPA
ncbi:hypothetical protein LAZ67_22000555 [Cordylochernes scorpioides]|uniref:Uncharacterized protein n=1 Tax=Cordylochernes scorpioides TaxID=51811 RepID=A0ABY6LQP2_9ARAC|nr:hypothetical protein LAZ67_22000555 [Cordylochernes scorpioides]